MPPASAGSSAEANAASVRAHLLGLLAPVVEATGHDLEDVTVTPAGRRSVVRVIVDADDGVDLDAVAAVSRAVSEAMDAAGDDVVPGAYVLEVSSPGVERPLTEQRHWRRAAGRLVSLPVADKPVTGRVVSTSPAGLTLDIEGEQREVPWDAVGSGRVHIEFNRNREE